MAHEDITSPIRGELGSTGLDHFQGVIQEEFLPELRGDRWHKVIAEMETTDIISAVLFAIEMQIQKVTWQVKPAADDAASEEDAEFIRWALAHMEIGWPDTLSEILSMIPYGWSYLEKVFAQREDGKIVWKKWAPRAQRSLERWVFGEGDEVLGIVQRGSVTGGQSVFIPIEKALHFRSRVKMGSPEGVSLLRRAYSPWYFSRRIGTVEAIWLERDLTGIPTIKVPSRILTDPAYAAELAAWKTLGTNIRNDEMACVIAPSDRDERGNLHYEVGLMGSPGARPVETSQIIERYDQRMAMTVLADFILIGHERTGSFALSEDKTEMFESALTGWVDGIADVINRDAIPQLLVLNGRGGAQGFPSLVHGTVGRVNLEELGQYVVRLAGAGVNLEDAELQSYLLQQGNLPISTRPMENGANGARPPLNRQAPVDAVTERNQRAAEEKDALLLAAARILQGVE